jgi:hypothetical protein
MRELYIVDKLSVAEFRVFTMGWRLFLLENVFYILYILNLFRYFAGLLHLTLRRHNLFQIKHKILELAKQMVALNLTRADVLILLASRTAATFFLKGDTRPPGVGVLTTHLVPGDSCSVPSPLVPAGWIRYLLFCFRSHCCRSHCSHCCRSHCSHCCRSFWPRSRQRQLRSHQRRVRPWCLRGLSAARPGRPVLRSLRPCSARVHRPTASSPGSPGTACPRHPPGHASPR